MQFVVKRDTLLKSLNFVQGIVEKKNTLPILSNVLLQLKNKKLSIVATDLDIIFYDEIEDVRISTEGSTTTSASILYDILRKISSNSELSFDLKTKNKLSLKSENSDFNLLCLPTDNFPTFADEFKEKEISIKSNKFLKLLNKTKISISNDDTRHYLNGVFIHLTESQGKNFLTGGATDSHRLSSSSIEIENISNFSSLILPRKTVFQLCSLLADNSEDLNIQTSENKIKFTLGKMKLVSKVIDGNFPDYRKVVPTNNDKKLIVSSKDFINSIERAVDFVIKGQASSILTSPICKKNLIESGFKYLGHTEFISKILSKKYKKNFNEVMILSTTKPADNGKNLRVGLVTTHIPLKEVISFSK